MLEEKAKTYKQTQNEWLQQVQNLKESYERQREEITSSIKEHTLKEQQVMTEKLLQKQQEIEKEVRILDDKYNLTVIDYENNTVLNKDGFYFIRHAEPIKKVSSDDIKGKSSVGHVSFNTIGETAEPEVEFDFDIEL